MTRVLVGTSGFAYRAWKGRFYPANLEDAGMLAFYASRLGAVEINNTFYRMPAASVLERWRDETPDGFIFALKAPQRITHRKRLADAGDALSYFLDVSAALGRRRGPILFQLPPYALLDLDGLRLFLRGMPKGAPPAAFEFRHESWRAPEVAEELGARGMAVCVADTDEAPAAHVPAGRWAYLRLRRQAYSDEELRAWAGRLEGFETAFVFFKHEDEARGPELAARFQALHAAN